MKHGSLFSGIGGFDLAAQWMGWENVFHCEWNPFGRRVLEYYWPDAISYEDITQTDFTSHANQIDILTGGFPCQPYSAAGKRKGKEDERHLWPEMLRAIREIKPRYVVGENVRGLLNWNGGLVFNEVQVDLETEGYDVLPFLLPAAGVGAPHERYRIWFIAFNAQFSTDGANISRESSREGLDLGRNELSMARWQQGTDHIESSNINAAYSSIENDGQYFGGTKERQEPELRSSSKQAIDTYTNQKRSERGAQSGGVETIRKEANKQFAGLFEPPSWEEFPTQSPVCGGNDGLPKELDGITFSKWKNQSIAGFGNAVVPELVLQLFKAIQETDLQIQ